MSLKDKYDEIIKSLNNILEFFENCEKDKSSVTPSKRVELTLLNRNLKESVINFNNESDIMISKYLK